MDYTKNKHFSAASDIVADKDSAVKTVVELLDTRDKYTGLVEALKDYLKHPSLDGSPLRPAKRKRLVDLVEEYEDVCDADKAMERIESGKARCVKLSEIDADKEKVQEQ